MAANHHTMTLLQKIGILVFVFTAGCTGLEAADFGLGLQPGRPFASRSRRPAAGWAAS